jgi:hypothetical protein
MLGNPTQDIHSTAATPGTAEFVRVAQDSGAARCGVSKLVEPLRWLTGIGKSAFVSRGAGHDPAGAVTLVVAELDEAGVCHVGTAAGCLPMVSGCSFDHPSFVM